MVEAPVSESHATIQVHKKKAASPSRCLTIMDQHLPSYRKSAQAVGPTSAMLPTETTQIPSVRTCPFEAE